MFVWTLHTRQERLYPAEKRQEQPPTALERRGQRIRTSLSTTVRGPRPPGRPPSAFAFELLPARHYSSPHRAGALVGEVPAKQPQCLGRERNGKHSGAFVAPPALRNRVLVPEHPVPDISRARRARAQDEVPPRSETVAVCVRNGSTHGRERPRERHASVPSPQCVLDKHCVFAAFYGVGCQTTRPLGRPQALRNRPVLDAPYVRPPLTQPGPGLREIRGPRRPGDGPVVQWRARGRNGRACCNVRRRVSPPRSNGGREVQPRPRGLGGCVEEPRAIRHGPGLHRPARVQRFSRIDAIQPLDNPLWHKLGVQVGLDKRPDGVLQDPQLFFHVWVALWVVAKLHAQGVVQRSWCPTLSGRVEQA